MSQTGTCGRGSSRPRQPGSSRRVLALYRTHEAADTARAVASGRSVREEIASIQLARGYLDAERSAAYTRVAYATKRREAWWLARLNGDRAGLARRNVYLRIVARCLAGELMEFARGREVISDPKARTELGLRITVQFGPGGPDDDLRKAQGTSGDARSRGRPGVSDSWPRRTVVNSSEPGSWES